MLGLVHALDRRFERTVKGALAARGTREPLFPLRLPAPLRATLEELGPEEPARAWYCERMPRMLIEQTLRGDDAARALLWRPLVPERLPRLAEALGGLRRLQPAADELIEGRASIAALAGGTLLGTGLPLIGALPADLARIDVELRGREADEVLDLRLSSGVLHELCHGPPREQRGAPVPWMILEACALWLGSEAWPRHVFPEEPGEALPGVSLFVLLGQCLARLFGESAMKRLGFGEVSLEEAFGEDAARTLRQAELRDWRARRQVPFARDALSALEWVSLVEGEWGLQPAGPLDLHIARTAVRALFQVNVMAGAFETRPLAAIGGVVLDVRRRRIERRRVAAGVFGEPAFWIWPPPFCRRLAERGVRRIEIEAAEREGMDGLADALVELSEGSGPLPAEIKWTSSPK